ncbi:GyrI-like domain-containing protein [Chryseobacterium sp. TY4]
MKALKIVGIETRTSNENAVAIEDLGKLWAQFFGEKIASKIPNKISDNIYAVYTDYETDYQGKYTIIIGCAVENLDKIPEGLIGRKFAAQKSVKFLAKGEILKAVGETWGKIWAKDKELNRTYLHDYEVYGEKAQDPNNAEIEIFIGIK